MRAKYNTLALIVAAVLILTSCSEPDNAKDQSESACDQTTGMRPVLKSRGVGTPNGTGFDDVGKLKDAIFSVRSITIANFFEVDSLQLTYSLKNGSLYSPPTHGAGFTVPTTITLAEDEYLAKIEGTIVGPATISQVFITIKTPNRLQTRVYGTYGAYVGEQKFSFEGFIIGIHGKTGPQIIRNLGVYYLAPIKESAYFGEPTVTFKENPDAKFPPVVKVSKILLYHGEQINSFQAEYKLLGGKSRLGDRHGGKGGDLTVIRFSCGEELIGLKGKLKGGTSGAISQLTFVSRKRDGSRAVYGPFGKAAGDTPFSVKGNILGFTGKATDTLESISAFFY